MYDYRAPRKKGGAVNHRRVSSATSSRQRSVAAHHRRVHQPARRPSRPRQPWQWPSMSSWVIGLVLLAVIGLISYIFIFKTVLPLIVPVAKEEVVAWMPNNETVGISQPITLVRISPAARQMVIVHGVLPASQQDPPVPVSWQVGIPIDRMLTVGGLELGGADRQSVEALFWHQIPMKAISGTDPRTALSWWAFSRSLSNAQITTYEVENGNWEKARRLLSFTRDTNHCPVALVNTTAVSGVANQLSRLIEPAGFLVVKVTDDQVMQDKTSILVESSQPECVAEAQSLNAFMVQPLAIQMSNNVVAQTVIQPTNGIVAQYRAPIVIKIGQDLGTMLDQWGKAQ